MKVYLGIGSNMGDKKKNLKQAVEKVARLPGVQVCRKSSLYETEPWGKTDQDFFLNAVLEAETEDVSPEELLGHLKAIEAEMGRVAGERWGPRVIDLDILLFGGLAVQSRQLTIPHRYMHERAFVMVPLAELIPDKVVRGQKVEEWAQHLQNEGIKIVAPSSDW